ncbi:hypothetical protein [Sulfurovum mangrovi]|uniref:hypothetical protein n=1 Tax=Sulfurovum mangrovi TaxID=2893889 RepID=UPI001E31681E|nr:hypothetical protein [Sulfurovum mangrovi]UFH59613.1 hypothetical protein LN246_01880 [Sulfurovum mangrovi]UFH60754.1 hypothetical protein LN246_14460 [Sulfurovum mangrovi]
MHKSNQLFVLFCSAAVIGMGINGCEDSKKRSVADIAEIKSPLSLAENKVKQAGSATELTTYVLRGDSTTAEEAFHSENDVLEITIAQKVNALEEDTGKIKVAMAGSELPIVTGEIIPCDINGTYSAEIEKEKSKGSFVLTFNQCEMRESVENQFFIDVITQSSILEDMIPSGVDGWSYDGFVSLHYTIASDSLNVHSSTSDLSVVAKEGDTMLGKLESSSKLNVELGLTEEMRMSQPSQ